jgi:hypothetical protein
MTNGQIVAIVTKYMSDNSAQWYKDMPLLVAEAMAPVCKR